MPLRLHAARLLTMVIGCVYRLQLQGCRVASHGDAFTPTSELHTLESRDGLLQFLV